MKIVGDNLTRDPFQTDVWWDSEEQSFVRSRNPHRWNSLHLCVRSCVMWQERILFFKMFLVVSLLLCTMFAYTHTQARSWISLLIKADIKTQVLFTRLFSGGNCLWGRSNHPLLVPFSTTVQCERHFRRQHRDERCRKHALQRFSSLERCENEMFWHQWWVF